ncbi:MAG TPA: hypothetical protein VFZ09_38335 [Archangium sp.]|uniref:hypothetical protein n=1 Tax=Archangium sp. TaxID=1872627 RepID=UPI002E2EB5D9|nr:hypothetical protein [Archangium sp.]HEX5752138.1 hypothetical protein [Archangium sp.]
MFVIDRNQMQILDALAERDFHRALMAFVRRELPDHTAHMEDAELRTFIRESQAHAERHGIESDRGVAQYVCLALETTPAFADDPNISKFLHLPGMSPEVLLEELVDLLNEMPEH